MTRRRLSAATDAAIRDRWHAGERAPDIAAALGVSVPTVYLRMRGVPRAVPLRSPARAPLQARSARRATAGDLLPPPARPMTMLLATASGPMELTLDSLLPRIAEPLLRYAGSLTHNDDSAQDLYQATVERLLTRFPQFAVPPGADMTAAFRRWAFTVMHNLFADDCRRAKRRATVPLDQLPAMAAPAMPPAQDEALAVADVRRLFNRLPAADGVVLHPHAIEGLRADDVAARLGVATGTIKSRTYRARRRLAGLLQEAGIAPPKRQRVPA